jgi:hypothetical protein
MEWQHVPVVGLLAGHVLHLVLLQQLVGGCLSLGHLV